MPDYFDLVRMSESYAALQNETKRRKIENKNAFNIFSDDNINSFNSNSNSLHDSTTIHTHNRTLQDVTFIINNRSSSKKNRSRRVIDFKNKRSLSSRNKWFYVVYVDANIIEIKSSKSKKGDKFFDFKNQTLKRFIRQPRAERHALFFSFFFVMQFSRRSKRIKKERVAKKKFFFEFRAQTLLKNEKKKKIF